MSESKNKTRPAGDRKGALDYINNVDHKGRREDALLLLPMMEDITKETARLWGPSIVGFGSYHYVYDSGREGDGPLTGFAPRKANMVVYVMPGFDDYPSLLADLGKHKVGKSCLYLGRLSGVDMGVLRKLVVASVNHMKKKYP